MLYGLLAALGFGLADLLTAITARRIGTFVTLLVSQIVGLALLVGYALLARPELGGADPGAWTLMLLGGVAAGAGYFALYRALELGPIALVSPIIAADAAFGVVLFVIFLHEALPLSAVAAVTITILGVILASFDPRRVARETSDGAKGIPFALVSLVFFTVGLFAVGYYSKRFGWFLPILTSRLGTMAVILSWLARTRGRDLRAKVPGRSLALAVLIGLFDLGGLAVFTRGTQLGLASVVTAATATFPLIPVVGGLVLFGERPASTQLAGVVLVIGGLVVLGLAS